MNSSPTLKEWKSLYAAAIAFRDMRPWEWMTDDMVFGVQDPETGEVGYCVVLGALDEVYALNVYVGAAGLETYRLLYSSEIDPEDVDVLFTQQCLMVSFEDRSSLQEEDFKAIKLLGLKFRGRNRWPLFRDHTPGYFPWYINSSQARFLVFAFQQALELALRLQTETLPPQEAGAYLVRVPKTLNDTLQWEDQWQLYTPPPPPPMISPLPNESVIQRLKSLRVVKDATWEVDYAYAPTTIQEKPSERPYFPKMLLCLDHHRGIALDSYLFAHNAPPGEVQERILGLFERLQCIPGQIKIKRAEAGSLLSPMASRLGITLTTAKRLPAIEELNRGMLDFVNQRGRQ